MVAGEHRANILWYLKQPRKIKSKLPGHDEFTYQRIQRGEETRWSWQVLYKGEEVIVVRTKQEAINFIKEKLEN